MKALIGTMMMISAGCTATPAAEAGIPVHGGGGCNAAPAQKLVGRARSQAAGAEARRLSGAAILRWIPEGTVVTMEYREDRINLHLNARKRIVRINCG
jgi:hypothetical protein